ncbi:MAG TPA: hypothetical protein VE913_04935 [Longimicrobium sp.]|nr:hypothetical protein [Longimicrobium sp.]
MLSKRFRGVLRVMVAALPLLAGCASTTNRGPAPTRMEVRVEVRNDLAPRHSATVRITSTTGSRSLLGAVSPGQTTVLSYQQPGFVGRYTLVAQVDGGPDVRSNTVVLRDGLRLVWALQANTLREVD